MLLNLRGLEQSSRAFIPIKHLLIERLTHARTRTLIDGMQDNKLHHKQDILILNKQSPQAHHATVLPSSTVWLVRKCLLFL